MACRGGWVWIQDGLSCGTQLCAVPTALNFNLGLPTLPASHSTRTREQQHRAHCHPILPKPGKLGALVLGAPALLAFSTANFSTRLRRCFHRSFRLKVAVRFHAGKTAQAKHNAQTTTCHSEIRTSLPPEISGAASVRPGESAPLLSRAAAGPGSQGAIFTYWGGSARSVAERKEQGFRIFVAHM